MWRAQWAKESQLDSRRRPYRRNRLRVATTRHGAGAAIFDHTRPISSSRVLGSASNRLSTTPRARHLVCLHPTSEALRLDAARRDRYTRTDRPANGGWLDRWCPASPLPADAPPGSASHRPHRVPGLPRADEIANHDANADSHLERLNAAQLSNRFDERESASPARRRLRALADSRNR